jgi:hypothetical protein
MHSVACNILSHLLIYQVRSSVSVWKFFFCLFVIIRFQSNALNLLVCDPSLQEVLGLLYVKY